MTVFDEWRSGGTEFHWQSTTAANNGADVTVFSRRCGRACRSNSVNAAAGQTYSTAARTRAATSRSAASSCTGAPSGGSASGNGTQLVQPA
jgi:hypothetical protein